MAVYGTVTAKAAPGKMAQAMEWALKIPVQMENSHGFRTEVLTNVAGDASTIHWVTKYDSLAQYEEFHAKQMANAEYLTLVQEANEAVLFTEISVHVYQVVS